MQVKAVRRVQITQTAILLFELCFLRTFGPLTQPMIFIGNGVSAGAVVFTTGMYGGCR